MVEEGYYSNRIIELEKRKSEVQGQLVTAQLTLEGIDREIEKCEDAMQNLGTQHAKDIKQKERHIQTLNKEISKQNEQISFLNRIILDKDSRISELESVIERKDSLLATVKSQNIHLKAKLKGVKNVFEDKILLEQYSHLITKK